MKKVGKIIGITLLVFLASFIALSIAASYAPPPEISAQFTELDKIQKISKYRNCVGHTTVPQDGKEMKRSMKHYFAVKPAYLGNTTVAVYAPYDGFVAEIREDRAEGLEGEIWIMPKNIFAILPPIGRWSFSVQHINIREGLSRGSEVRAGEQIGYAAAATQIRNTFDIVYAQGSPTTKRIDNWTSPFRKLDSVFNHMSAEVFAQYQNKGISSKDALIISKDERDQDPCTYQDDGPYFIGEDTPEHWVTL